MQKVIIIGAGPAGLTAGYELSKYSDRYNVTILEETDEIGGLSRTVGYNGNRMDIGGHRFFSKSEKVNEWWKEILPEGDPEKEDLVMMDRDRLSRIYFNDTFFDYPITVKSLFNLKFAELTKCGFSYLRSMFRKKPETNLENFYINRFGKRLYELFFEYYTENLWGKHPREIDASWGEQRVKGLSAGKVLKDVFKKIFHIKNGETETSLIESFKYPKYGPGQLWETVAEKIEENGGTIIKNAKVDGIHIEGHKADSVSYNGKWTDADIVISSMPVNDLISAMDNVPEKIRKIKLPYRDYMTLGVLVKELTMDIKDNWIYVQDRRVKLGRIQIYNNWSPYLVGSDGIWLGLEYFVAEGDEYWNMSEEDFSRMAIDELIAIGLLKDRKDVKDTHLVKVKKAYPAYFDDYQYMNRIVDFLSSVDNLYCVGRNGQHRYNNMDHSMCTAFEAVDNILINKKDKGNIWAVNTEGDYHENG